MTDFGAVTELYFVAILFLICAGVSIYRNVVHRKTGFWRGVFSKSVGIWVSAAAVTAFAAGPVGRWLNDDRFRTIAPLPKSDYLDDKRGETAIVFVHGVLGNGDATFRHAVNNTYWPELLRQDPLFSESSIFIFNYFSVLWHPGQSFVNLADDLKTTLDHHEVFIKHKRVVFLAHSMGGLVVRQFLVNHVRDKEEVIDKVPFVYFFASPTLGNPMADLVSIITDNKQFYHMRTDAVDMTALEGAWRNARLPIKSYCAYELNGYAGGKLIVSKESATHLCSNHAVEILKDHSEIVKPVTLPPIGTRL